MDKETDLGLLKYTKRVTLNSVADENLIQVITCFLPHFHSLTMINMDIQRDLIKLPVKKLTLIRVTIENSLLNHILKTKMDDLEYLYLDGVKTTMMWDLNRDLQALPNLLHLTINCNRPRIYGNPKLFGPLMRTYLYIPLSPYYNRLESIYWDFQSETEDMWMYLPQYHNLKSLTLQRWREGLELPLSLEHLRIIAPICSRIKKAVDSLGLKRVEVDYYDYASEGQQNGLVKMLNSDCLLKIAEKL